MALAFAMALQELATNAVKYGALSNADGEVHIAWSVRHAGSEGRLHLSWTESGGPTVEPPKRRGFGTRLIERSLAQDLDGDARLDPFHDGGRRGADRSQGKIDHPVTAEHDDGHENPAENFLEPDTPAATLIALLAP
jgi:hypothetical protein